MLLGGPQNTIKSHLVFTALFCFAPFSVFSSRMSAPHCFLLNRITLNRATLVLKSVHGLIDHSVDKCGWIGLKHAWGTREISRRFSTALVKWFF
jgi:hypothetical protein